MNVKIHFVKTYNEDSYCIWFCFHDLYSYEVVIPYDEFGYVANMAGVEEITRLLNAANLFRQWEKDRWYTSIELRRAIENIYNENVENGVEWKEYHLAMIGSAPKTADNIIVANV